MNYTVDQNGNSALAIGAPGSLERLKVENRRFYKSIERIAAKQFPHEDKTTAMYNLLNVIRDVVGEVCIY